MGSKVKRGKDGKEVLTESVKRRGIGVVCHGVVPQEVVEKI